ncbi:Bacterial extracellular solute-binding protein [Phytophthora infestans]|uniref:Bacterial extracellular solute-binding protein n=1 Tax=Phytophthora infestans TaxID=4787 RepID=A0A833T955_PHYIN|nr:Bacterial extracellular solute-binding protein [Phytophthora infestans]KAF4136773.1 Bacterial extracellular solute-binding protein [Phytophthora infestans]
MMRCCTCTRATLSCTDGTGWPSWLTRAPLSTVARTLLPNWWLLGRRPSVWVPISVAIIRLATNNTEYIAWGQRAAILAKARHPAAAKLFMNWALSEEVQSNTVAPSVRTDINTDKPWDVPEANMAGFLLFMEDRETVEEWKQTFTLYIGEVQGVGLYPGL